MIAVVMMSVPDKPNASSNADTVVHLAFLASPTHAAA
jgi:hypothetical protein